MSNTKKYDMPPKERTILIPNGGWKERTYYTVWVAANKNNPIWPAIFYTGFLNDGNGGPGGYNMVWSGSSDPLPIDKIHYMEVIADITDKFSPSIAGSAQGIFNIK